MRLRVAVILSRGRYIAAGEEIADDDVPAVLKRYRVDDSSSAQQLDENAPGLSMLRPDETTERGR
jgi:hypothetical protein